jgi:hypothetical protein
MPPGTPEDMTVLNDLRWIVFLFAACVGLLGVNYIWKKWIDRK